MKWASFLKLPHTTGPDIYLFQQLGRTSRRGVEERLIVVGILHQACSENTRISLSRQLRDEWSKIQGRFVDLIVNTTETSRSTFSAGRSRANISSDPPGSLAEGVAGLAQGHTSPHLAEMLEDCWPLHPVSACLLGPLSRRRFGQNQRSIFGFLNSAEPQGFQDFLRNASAADLYGPDRLWDYLRITLEPSILASPDGHRGRWPQMRWGGARPWGARTCICDCSR